MASLLDLTDDTKGLLGIPGASVLQIKPPDDSGTDQGQALAQVYNNVTNYIRAGIRKWRPNPRRRPGSHPLPRHQGA